MKFIYCTVFRHSDRKVLLSTFNIQCSQSLQTQASHDFNSLSASFRKTSIYEGMREVYDDASAESTYNPEVELEIGGRPVWYSTCDGSLLVYSGE